MIEGTRKMVKNLVCAGIVTLALAGGVREARAESHQNYFPLNVGNSWTYVDCNDGSTKTFTIIGKEEIHGHTYYRFDSYFAMLNFPGQFPGDDILFRYDPNSDKVWQVWHWCPIAEEVRYDFSGNMWGCCGNVLIETGVSYTVPAGQFDNCCKFWYGQMCDAGEFYETLAAGIGNIRHEAITFNENFELQSYRIVPYCGDANHPYPVGDLNEDCRVDLLDFAILASHWLEDNTPVNSNSIVEDGIEYYIQTNKSIYDLGEDVEMLYRVTNLRGEEVSFIFGNPLQYNFHITDVTGASVWKYYLHSSECPFCRVPSSFSLQPSESIEFNAIWNITNDNDTVDPNDDYPVQAGNHNVIGMLWLGLCGPGHSDEYGYCQGVEFYVPVLVSIDIIP